MAAVSMAVEDARFLKRNFLYFRPELSNSYPTWNTTSQRLPRQPLRIQYPKGGAPHSHANEPSVEYGSSRFMDMYACVITHARTTALQFASCIKVHVQDENRENNMNTLR